MVSQHWPSPVIPLAKPMERRPGPALGTSPGRALEDRDFIGTFWGLSSGFPALAQPCNTSGKAHGKTWSSPGNQPWESTGRQGFYRYFSGVTQWFPSTGPALGTSTGPLVYSAGTGLDQGWCAVGDDMTRDNVL